MKYVLTALFMFLGAFDAEAQISTLTELPAYYTQCAVENGSCAVGAPVLAIFGAPGGYTLPVLMSKGFYCNSQVFGNPFPSAVKACYTATADSQLPPPPNQVPSTPIPLIDAHGFYIPGIFPGLETPSSIYAIWPSQPVMCLDPANTKSWADSVTNDTYKSGWCSTIYGDFTWTRHMSKHPVVPVPDTWPTEGP